MGPISTAKEEKYKSLPTNGNHNQDTAINEGSPPIYYDSEPSSQQPKYQGSSTIYPQPTSALNPITSDTKHPKPPHQHRNSAPVANVATILACLHDDLDAQRRADRKKKTVRER
jgi:hypothetical protein